MKGNTSKLDNRQEKTRKRRGKKKRKKSTRACHANILVSVILCLLLKNPPFPSPLLFSPALEIRSQLFSLLFDLRVHKPPSVYVPPPTPKTGKDFPSNINPINAY